VSEVRKPGMITSSAFLSDSSPSNHHTELFKLFSIGRHLETGCRYVIQIIENIIFTYALGMCNAIGSEWGGGAF
jgi:hypothetical protein